MALFTVDIEKQLSSEYWTNRYFVRTDTLANAVPQGQDIVDAERLIHSSLVSFTKLRVSTADPENEEYTIVTLGVNGLTGVTNLLPLFNTLRFDFTAATGRPSRKYYRGVLGEEHISGDLVTYLAADFETAIEALFAIGAEGAGIVDPQQTNLTDAVRWPFVQMRQLRRAKKRKNIPVFQ
jgi:hypothetical protein